jgi:hypothetical protein
MPQSACFVLKTLRSLLKAKRIFIIDGMLCNKKKIHNAWHVMHTATHAKWQTLCLGNMQTISYASPRKWAELKKVSPGNIEINPADL